MKFPILTLYPAFLVAAGIAAFQEAAPMRPHSPRVYAVEIGGRLGGYRVERCDEAELEGRRVLVFQSRTALRTGPSGRGGAGTTVWDITCRVDPETGRVLRARRIVRRGKAIETREASFEEGRAEYQVSTPEGEVSTRDIDLPEDVLVPLGLAYPAVALMKSGRSESGLPLFRMEDGSVRTVTVTKKGQETLAFHGRTHACIRYALSEEGQPRSIEMWITSEGEPVKVDRPSEGLTYSPAAPEVAERLARAAPSRIAFTAVNTEIENRAALTYLSLEAVLESAGIENTADLNTPDQIFEGRLVDGRIEGTFRIYSSYFNGGEALDIPATPEEAARLAPYLSPEDGIESGSPLIRRRALEAVKGLKQRWHAAHALGVWVRKNIVLDPAGEDDAASVLEQGTAGVEGFARLHVALCRSLGIPARMVQGGLYLKTGKGGGFTRHTWSEVFLGKSGWIPMDAAAGQLNFLDAGHIRIGESRAFRPVELRIKDYIPKPPELRAPVETVRAEFPITAGETHRYAHTFDGEQVGLERIAFLGEEEAEGGKAFRFTSELALAKVKGKTTTLAGRDGRLHYYKAELGEGSRTYRVEGGEVLCETVSEDRTDRRKVRLPPEGLFFDNQQIFHLGFLASRLPLEEGRPIQVEVLHPLSARVLSIQAERKGRRVEEIGGRSLEVDVIEFRSGFQRMILYMTSGGLVVKELEQGGRAAVVWLGEE